MLTISSLCEKGAEAPEQQHIKRSYHWLSSSLEICERKGTPKGEFSPLSLSLPKRKKGTAVQ